MNYRTFGITLTPHGRDKVVVHSRDGGTASVLPRAQVHLLLSCSTFKPLHEHAARNQLLSQALDEASGANTDPADPAALVKRHLEVFIQAGFLVSEADLLKEVRSPEAPREDARGASNTITALGIPTRDRPESLGRALASYVENAVERMLDIAVVDDSRGADTQARNQDALRAVPV